MLKNKKLSLIIAAAVILLVTLVTVVYIFMIRDNKQQDSSQSTSASCTEEGQDEYIDRFYAIQKPASEDDNTDAQLSELAREVSSDSNHSNNINCMYILTYSSIREDSIDEANSNLERIRELKDEGQAISEGFIFETLDYLEKKLTHAEGKLNEIISNSIGIPGTGSE